jgi:cytochrome c biogenesis protein CcmG/thiol:disulfide interchange protein DsbE
MDMKRLILWAPLILFVAFVGVFAAGLINPSSKTIPSQLIGKPLPRFSLPQAVPERPGLGSANFQAGQPRLLNIFASWCIPCAAEAPQLLQLAQAGVPIDAIAIRDRAEDIQGFLGRWGNPYQRIGSDTTSSVQIALGSAGVPETFVIDGRGVIRHQHIGEIRPEDLPAIMSALAAAK